MSELDVLKNHDRFLCFNCGPEEFAIPLLTVREVIAMPEVTPIPHMPTHFLGIMNLRGQVISVVDLRTKLGIKPSSSTETAVIICDVSPMIIGVVVDSINSVLNPKSEEISEKPDLIGVRSTEYISGVYRKDKKMILFLDIRKNFSPEEQAALQKNVKKAA